MRRGRMRGSAWHTSVRPLEGGGETRVISLQHAEGSGGLRDAENMTRGEETLRELAERRGQNKPKFKLPHVY